MYVCVRMYVRMYVRTCLHAYIHTYVCVCIYKCKHLLVLPNLTHLYHNASSPYTVIRVEQVLFCSVDFCYRITIDYECLITIISVTFVMVSGYDGFN